jgi:hypothetical protein
LFIYDCSHLRSLPLRTSCTCLVRACSWHPDSGQLVSCAVQEQCDVVHWQWKASVRAVRRGSGLPSTCRACADCSHCATRGVRRPI